jgi:predicted metal-dependent phosphoesterase TrpH
MHSQDWADLHIHTYYSDGTSSPREILEQSQKEGFKCIALTDHDTLDGVKEAQNLSAEFGIEVLSGVELSTTANDRDVHLLAYMFDVDHSELAETLKAMQATRLKRMEEIIDKLKQAGINNISLEEIVSQVRSDAVGRLHIANLLIKKGVVNNLKAAFDKYLSEGAVAFVPKYKITTQEAIELVHRAKGVTVLAHPMLTNIDERIPEFVRAGLDGLEVFYPNITSTTTEYYQGLAKKHNILTLGGSDAHGQAKKNTYLGKVKIPYVHVEALKEYHRKKFPHE